MQLCLNRYWLLFKLLILQFYVFKILETSASAIAFYNKCRYNKMYIVIIAINAYLM